MLRPQELTTTMACDDYYCLDSQLPSLAWNLDDIGAITGAELGCGLRILNQQTRLVKSPGDTAVHASGYLEDAVAQWSDWCKRRRTLQFPHGRGKESLDSNIVEDLVQDFWYSNGVYFDTFVPALDSLTEDSDNAAISGVSAIVSTIPTEEAATAEEPIGGSMLTREDQEFPSSYSASSSSSSKDFPLNKAINMYVKRTMGSQPTVSSSSVDLHPTIQYKFPEDKDTHKRKSKLTTWVLYPFAVLRPGAVDGGMTLKDVNRRLLMRPTRPVRHPVGEFACLPCVSGVGRGPSGKVVVHTTRIQTPGTGTITIIRTKG